MKNVPFRLFRILSEGKRQGGQAVILKGRVSKRKMCNPLSTLSGQHVAIRIRKKNDPKSHNHNEAAFLSALHDNPHPNLCRVIAKGRYPRYHMRKSSKYDDPLLHHDVVISMPFEFEVMPWVDTDLHDVVNGTCYDEDSIDSGESSYGVYPCGYVRPSSKANVLTVEQATYIMTCVTRSVVHMHKLGFAHRDIKMENVLVSNDFSTVMLCDYGWVCRCSSYEERTSSAAGTDGFHTPEYELYRRYNPWNMDSWHLGIFFAEILQVFGPDQNDVEWCNVRDIPCSGLDENIAAVLKGLTQRNPTVRMTAERALEILEGLDCKDAQVVSS